jgi:hypothetical protein
MLMLFCSRVVYASVAAAILTVLIVITTAILDSLTKHDGTERIIPINLFRENSPNLEKYRRWRDFLGNLAFSACNTSLAIGICQLIAAYVMLGGPPTMSTRQSPHGDSYWNIVIYQACIASANHLTALLVLRNGVIRHRGLFMVWIWILIAYAILLIVTIDLSQYAYQTLFEYMEKVFVITIGNRSNYALMELNYVLQNLLPPLIMFVIYWNAMRPLVVPILESPAPKSWALWVWRVSRCLFLVKVTPRWTRWNWPCKTIELILVKNPIARLLSKPSVVFLMQLASVVLAVGFLLAQKLTIAPRADPSWFTQADLERNPDVDLRKIRHAVGIWTVPSDNLASGSIYCRPAPWQGFPCVFLARHTKSLEIRY